MEQMHYGKSRGKRFCTNLGGSALIIKIVATRGEIFSLKFTKYRLAAGLSPDPLGELKHSPRPPSRNNGGLLLRGGERQGRGEGEGKERGKLASRC